MWWLRCFQIRYKRKWVLIKVIIHFHRAWPSLEPMWRFFFQSLILVHFMTLFVSTTISHIDSVFRKQKSGIRAVMPGYVQFKYRDGQIPTYTKSTFTSLNVLTVHSIIVKMLLFSYTRYEIFHYFFRYPLAQQLNQFT